MWSYSKKQYKKTIVINFGKIFHVSTTYMLCHPYIPVYTVLYHLLNILIIGPTSTTGTNRPSRG